MAKIKLDVEMRSGTGFGVWVTINEKSYHFSESDSTTITIDPNVYVATVGGHEPTTSRVKITISQNGTELAKEEYMNPTFFGFIPFTVN